MNQRLSADGQLRVEAREAKRRTDAVDEGRDPADAPHAAQRPFVHDERRRRAEGDHVGEAVVLRAERRLRAREPRHAPVQAVEHHRHEDRDRRALEIVVHPLHDRVEARRRGRAS